MRDLTRGRPEWRCALEEGCLSQAMGPRRVREKCHKGFLTVSRQRERCGQFYNDSCPSGNTCPGCNRPTLHQV